MALGEDVAPDYRALPRATYMDPEAASVGVSLDAGARGRARRVRVRRPTSRRRAKGYSVEAETGHVTIVVDRATRQLVGAAMACPDASAAIHECVLAIKARVPVDVLAETIHAFPSHVADLQRAVRGGAGDARRRSRERGRALAAAPGAPASGGAGGDRAVDEHEPRPGVPQRPADLDGLVERRRRAARRRRRGGPAPAARGRARPAVSAGSTHAARSERHSEIALRRARAAASPAGHDGAARVTAHATPGHGSIGSTGASVPNGMSAPVARDRRRAA